MRPWLKTVDAAIEFDPSKDDLCIVVVSKFDLGSWYHLFKSIHFMQKEILQTPDYLRTAKSRVRGKVSWGNQSTGNSLDHSDDKVCIFFQPRSVECSYQYVKALLHIPAVGKLWTDTVTKHNEAFETLFPFLSCLASMEYLKETWGVSMLASAKVSCGVGVGSLASLLFCGVLTLQESLEIVYCVEGMKSMCLSLDEKITMVHEIIQDVRAQRHHRDHLRFLCSSPQQHGGLSENSVDDALRCLLESQKEEDILVTLRRTFSVYDILSMPFQY